MKYTDDNEAVTSLEFNYPGSLLRPDRSECRHHAHGPEPHEGYPGRVDPRQHGHARQVQAQDQAGRPGDGSFAALMSNSEYPLSGHSEHPVPLLPRHAVRAALRVELPSVAVQSGAYYLHTYLQYLHTYLHTISTVFTRRRYKVVAEQYCKISPLICMVCLFFEL